MERILSAAFATILALSLQAQTTDLVVFSDDGTKFTLIVDGDVKNDAPATRVVATGIRTETPVMMLKFEDAAIPPVKQNAYLEMGKEYTMMLTTNKKGAKVLRMTGEAALGTAAKEEPVKPAKPAEFNDTPATTTTVVQEVAVPADEVITTTTVIEEGDPDMDGENVNINMGVNGVNFNMSVNAGSTGSSTSTTRTTTTTTTTRSSSSSSTTEPAKPIIDTKPKPSEPEVYNMPGYSGRVGCGWPMSPSEFADVKKSIESKSFEDSKMTLAKQVGSNRCFTVDQVKGLMSVFSFEDSKLDIAKFAYDRTFDIDNYYKVNDAFTFESSIDDLNEYIQSR
ncbi:MAG TPA: DUF4476 domain-containing protein [Flavobacteriales bacterium]|nr:DUF4476 domain-containing protein [Flavobacteriales bacterium]